jgi:hypothetical protein
MTSACAIRLNSALTPEQKALFQSPDQIRNVLATARTIAIVGLSAEPQKASHFVASYLQDAGYRIVPVNPRGGVILGETVYGDLAKIPFAVDVVDVFRPSPEVDALAVAAIQIGAKVLWQQLRINNIPAATHAREAGLASIVDACIKMEHGRYSGGLHTVGMNTELVTARRPRFAGSAF